VVGDSFFFLDICAHGSVSEVVYLISVCAEMVCILLYLLYYIHLKVYNRIQKLLFFYFTPFAPLYFVLN